MATKTLPTIKKVEFFDKRKFVALTFDKNEKTFMLYNAIL